MLSAQGQYKAVQGWASNRDVRGALLSAVRRAKIEERGTQHVFPASRSSRC